MTGTIVNIFAVLFGGTFGTFLGEHFPERIKQTIVTGLGLFTLVYGIQLFLKTENAVIVLGSLLVGALLGEWWRIEKKVQSFGHWLESRMVHNGKSRDQDRFVKGFLTASLVFCVGPMSILGPIQDGLIGDFNLLVVKSILDGFSALAFASSLGIGVVFSVLVILIYQGGISLLATQVQAVITPEIINEMSAVGGVIIVGISISSLLEIRPIRSGNFLPAIIIVPIFIELINWVGVSIP